MQKRGHGELEENVSDFNNIKDIEQVLGEFTNYYKYEIGLKRTPFRAGLSNRRSLSIELLHRK